MDSPDRHASGPRHAPGTVVVDQPFTGEGLHALRATLAAHPVLRGVGIERREHLLIVASELASNAVRHGGGTGRLRLWCQADVLYCQVSDQGPGIADPGVGTRRPAPDGLVGGRGIYICRALANELIIERGPGGRGAVVTAVIGT